MYRSLKNYFTIDKKRESIFSDLGIIEYLNNLKNSEFDKYKRCQKNIILDLEVTPSYIDTVKKINSLVESATRNKEKQFLKYYPIPVISVLFNIYCQTIFRYTQIMEHPPKEVTDSFVKLVKDLYTNKWKNVYNLDVTWMEDKDVYKLFKMAHASMLPDTENTDKHEHMLKDLNTVKSSILISLNDCEHESIVEVRDMCIEILNAGYSNY